MGTLRAHIVDKNGVSVSGTVYATSSGATHTCQASGGMCSMLLPEGTWTITAKTVGGAKGGPKLRGVPAEGSVSVTLQVFPQETSAALPRAFVSNIKPVFNPRIRSKSMGNLAESRILGIGGTSMSSICKWVPVTDIPGVTDLQEVAWTTYAVTDLPTGDGEHLGEAIVEDVVAQGEDVAEGVAIALNVSEVQYASHDKEIYVLVNTEGYVSLFKWDCYGQVRTLTALTGALLGGVFGWVGGDRFKGQGPMGAAVGIPIGTGLGYLIGKVISK